MLNACVAVPAKESAGKGPRTKRQRRILRDGNEIVYKTKKNKRPAPPDYGMHPWLMWGKTLPFVEYRRAMEERSQAKRDLFDNAARRALREEVA